MRGYVNHLMACEPGYDRTGSYSMRLALALLKAIFAIAASARGIVGGLPLGFVPECHDGDTAFEMDSTCDSTCS